MQPTGTIASKLLRRPEAEKFYNRGAAARYDETGLINLRSPHPPAEIVQPIDWRMDPYGDRTWQLYFHTLGWMQLFVHALDDPQPGTKRLTDPLADLKAITMSCIRDVLAEPPNMKHPQWDDHASAYRCSNLSFFYAHALAPILSEEERALFLQAIALHARTLSDFIASGKWADSNHLIFHVEGLADAWAVFRDDLPELDAMCDQAIEALIGFIDRSISEEGTTNEHASYYQAFLMGRISETISFFEGLGRPLPVDVAPRMRKAAAFLWNIMPRWGVLPPFGDTQFEKALNMRLVEQFQHEPWIGSEYRQWHDPDYTQQQPPPLISYPQNGFHILRNRPVRARDALYSLFLERPFRGPHGHWDGNSFMTYYGGEPYLIDCGGPFQYGNPLRYEYFQTQLAHNSVIFGGQPQSYETTVVASDSSDALTYVIGRAVMQDGSLWLRIFGHLGDKTVFAVDLARPSAEAAIDAPAALFHLSPLLSLKREGPAIRATGARSDALISCARPGGVEQTELSAMRMSRVTLIDTQFEEGHLLEQPLRPARPLLTLCSFADEIAHRVEIRDGTCHLSIGVPDGAPRQIAIPLPAALLEELGPPASDEDDAPVIDTTDMVRVINLDSDEERWDALQTDIARIGYAAERLGGVRGLYLPDLAVSAVPGAAGVERGTLGCFLSHLRAWEEIVAGAAPCGFVVEDDIAFAEWLPAGLIKLAVDSGYDFITCNRRIQEDETQPVADRSGQTPRVDPLIDAVQAKSKTFRAPGGEGYFLSRAGAAALIDMVRAHGIHGDVDWFMLWAALTPEERAQTAPDSRLRSHFNRLDRLYPKTAALRGGVLSPWMVQHTAPPSSRKRDNDAARANAPVNKTQSSIAPRQYRIIEKPRVAINQSRPSDFRVGVPLNLPFPTDKATAYVADFDARELVFTALPKERRLLDAPFFYNTQRREAEMLSRVPFDGLGQLYPESTEPLRPLIILSIGCSGANELSLLLNASGLTSISEPDLFSQADGLLGKLEAQYGQSKEMLAEDAVAVLRATVQSFCKWADTPSEQLALALRSQANSASSLIASALPRARFLFLYRELEEWLRVFGTRYSLNGKQMASTLYRGILACAELKRAGHKLHLLSYEDLLSDPMGALDSVLNLKRRLSSNDLANIFDKNAIAEVLAPDMENKALTNSNEFHQLWRDKRPHDAINELGLLY